MASTTAHWLARRLEPEQSLAVESELAGVHERMLAMLSARQRARLTRLSATVDLDATDVHPAPFAMLARDLRLAIVSPIPADHPGGGSRHMVDGTKQEPGGWNRFALEVTDLEATVKELRAAGVSFRSGIITGIGGEQALVADPSGNLIELFEPIIPEAHEGAAFKASGA